MEPFIRPGVPAYIMNTASKTVVRQTEQLRGWSTRLHLSLDLHAPTLLLPQKSASPNLIIMNMGEFKITEGRRMSWAVFSRDFNVFGQTIEFLEKEIRWLHISQQLNFIAGSSIMMVCNLQLPKLTLSCIKAITLKSTACFLPFSLLK
jgi:hypothetical protein